jgi:hypothetical protein
MMHATVRVLQLASDGHGATGAEQGQKVAETDGGVITSKKTSGDSISTTVQGMQRLTRDGLGDAGDLALDIEVEGSLSAAVTLFCCGRWPSILPRRSWFTGTPERRETGCDSASL